MTNKQRSSLRNNYITPIHWGFENISAMCRPNLLVAKRLSWFKRSNNWDTKTALDLDFSSDVTDESHTHIGETLTGSDPAAQATAGAALIRAKHLAQVIQYDVSAAPTRPYPNDCFDAVVRVDVVQLGADLINSTAEVTRVFKIGWWCSYDTMSPKPLARLTVITFAEGMMQLLSKKHMILRYPSSPTRCLMCFSAPALRSHHKLGWGCPP